MGGRAANDGEYLGCEAWARKLPERPLFLAWCKVCGNVPSSRGRDEDGSASMDKNSRIATIALFIALAVALHWVESLVPRPAPFLRFGLANIITLCTLYAFGGPWALFVVISRVVVASALSGGIFSPMFALSLGGGITAALVMWAMPKSLFSPIGVSVAGAASHMSAQLLIAVFLVAHLSLTYLLPVFLLVSVITGVINGYCCVIVMNVMEGRQNRFSLPRQE